MFRYIGTVDDTVKSELVVDVVVGSQCVGDVLGAVGAVVCVARGQLRSRASSRTASRCASGQAQR